MVTTTRINCKTPEAHNEVLNVLNENSIKHSYHVVDGWGLYSVVHSLRLEVSHLIANIKDVNIQNHDKNS